MKQYKKFAFIGVVIASGAVLTGCDLFGVSYIQTKMTAKKVAKEYIAEKYDEKFNGDEAIAYSPPGDGTPFPPSIGHAKITDTEKGYSVYVELDYKDGKVLDTPYILGDNKQLSEIKQDIKEKYLDSLPKGLKHEIAYLEVFDITSYTTKEEREKWFFGEEAYYDGDLEEFLKENEINLQLEVDFNLEESVMSQEIESHKREIERGLTKILKNFKGESSFALAKIYNQSKNEVYSLLISNKTKEYFWQTKPIQE